MVRTPCFRSLRFLAWHGPILTAACLGAVMVFCAARPAYATEPASPAESGAEVTINKKGLGKEVLVTKGSHEWYMLMEVTADNTVIVRQHKDGETYLLDESETHDRTFTPEEVESAITAFASSAKAQAAHIP